MPLHFISSLFYLTTLSLYNCSILHSSFETLYTPFTAALSLLPLLLIVPTPAFLLIHPIILSFAPILSLFHFLSPYSISYINSIASFPPFSPLYHSHPMLLLELLLMVLPLALLIFTLGRNPFLLHSFSTI